MFKRLFFIVLLSLPAWAAPHSVLLNWTASPDASGNPTLTYNVYRAAAPCTPIPATWTNIGNTGTLTLTDTNVSVGNTYCYKVRSLLGGLESVDSNLAPAVIPPAAPSGLTTSPD